MGRKNRNGNASNSNVKPCDQSNARRLRWDLHPQKSKDERKRFFLGTEPLPANGRTKTHPLYFDKARFIGDWNAYRTSVKEWVKFWYSRGKVNEVEDCVLHYVALISSKKDDPELHRVANDLMESMKNWFPQRQYCKMACECLTSDRVSNASFDLWMPLKRRPLKSLLRLFVVAWNENNHPNRKLQSPDRLSIFLDRYIEVKEDNTTVPDVQDPLEDETASNTSSDQEECTAMVESIGTVEVERDTFTLNEYKGEKCLAEILEAQGIELKDAVFILKKQYAIERIVYFGNTDYYGVINILAEKAAVENWGQDAWILRNVVDQTVVQQLQLGNIRPSTLEREKDEGYHYCHLNLIDRIAEPLLMRLQKYPPNRPPPYYTFCGFTSARDLGLSFEELSQHFPRPKWYGESFSLDLDI
jgi:hypothetical protein